VKISATIITFNEEGNLERCLKSLDFVDEIIVVDSESTDKTTEIAKKYTDKVYINKFEGYGQQKNYASNLAKNDIIFSIDADEEVSVELKKYLLEHGADIFSQGYSAIAIPRRTFYLGKFIKNSGWYPDYKIRIYDKNVCIWNNKSVHESLVCGEKIFYIPKNCDLYHYSYKNIEDHINKMNKYTTILGKEKSKLSNLSILLNLFTKPPLKFIKMYFLKGGIFEGYRGIVIAILGTFYEALKYIKAWEHKNG